MPNRVKVTLSIVWCKTLKIESGQVLKLQGWFGST
jgi:hypothetical protein